MRVWSSTPTSPSTTRSPDVSVGSRATSGERQRGVRPGDAQRMWPCVQPGPSRGLWVPWASLQVRVAGPGLTLLQFGGGAALSLAPLASRGPPWWSPRPLLLCPWAEWTACRRLGAWETWLLPGDPFPEHRLACLAPQALSGAPGSTHDVRSPSSRTSPVAHGHRELDHMPPGKPSLPVSKAPPALQPAWAAGASS